VKGGGFSRGKRGHFQKPGEVREEKGLILQGERPVSSGVHAFLLGKIGGKIFIVKQGNVNIESPKQDFF